MESFFASAIFVVPFIILFNLSFVLAVSLLLTRATLIFGELALFALLALWSLWDVAVHQEVLNQLPGADPLAYRLPLVMFLLAVIFALNHYRLMKQPTSKAEAERNLGWYIRYRFILVLKIAIAYAIVVSLIGMVLPSIFQVITFAGGVAMAVFWDLVKPKLT